MKKIRILFFIENLTEGGAEKVLCNLVNHMDQSQFDITVQTVFPAEYKKYLVPGIHYRSAYKNRTKLTRLRYRAETAAGLTYLLHIRGDYDIEAAYLESGPTKVMAASTNKKAVKLAWIHCDLSKRVSDSAALVEKSRNWYKKYDKVICVSRQVKKAYEELFAGNTEADIVYNVINDAYIRDAAEKPMTGPVRKRRFTIAAVGRLSYEKNYSCLLKVVSRLKKAGYAFDLWLVGDGPERDALEEQRDRLDLNDTVFFMGFQGNPYPFMKASDLLVSSSLYEGFSTFITEGLILGKPIVTTDCSGMEELLGDSKYGLITGNNEEDLYEGIKSMLEDEKLREKYAYLAARRGDDFSGDALTEKTQAYFKALIEEKLNV
jgi:glycosyltransferase involved in cell wall biosynthesis